MKILLVVPRRDNKLRTLSDFDHLLNLVSPFNETGNAPRLAYMPLALPTLAALTPANHDVRLVDGNIENIPYDEHFDLVGISVLSFASESAYAVADEFRRRKVFVALGGIHVSITPDEASEHADVIFIGEAEETWPQFLNDFSAGKRQARYCAAKQPNLSLSPVPRWDKVANHRYFTPLVQTTRGCNSSCSFCTVRALFGPPRSKSVEQVVAEILEIARQRRHPGRLRIMFSDDNIIANPHFAKALFRAIAPLKVSWTAQATFALAEDEELVSLARASGCDSLLIGLESISQENLDTVQKGRLNRVENFVHNIARLHEAGITVYSYVIFGLDGDTPDIFSRTFEFIQNNGIAFPLFNILTPMPGTPLFDELAREGRLLPATWPQRNGYSVCFVPKKISREQLDYGFRSTIRKTFSRRAIVGRMEAGFRNGSLRSRHADILLRLATTFLFLREAMRHFNNREVFLMSLFLAFSLWRYLWIKIPVVLMFYDRFRFSIEFIHIGESESFAEGNPCASLS
jgi:radical SAM superfamily enzyme YgiQ (UPF0313 family)